MGLDKAFHDFVNSDEATKTAFEVREDWREHQYEQALLNGDLHADNNPNTEVDPGWYEPEFEELSPDEVAAEELSAFRSLSKDQKD